MQSNLTAFSNRVEAGKLAASLNGLVDVNLLMEKLLLSARHLVRAEAGTVYLVENGQLKFVTSQNDYMERIITGSEDLPFLGYNLSIDRSTLAGYCATERTILTVNDTDAIDPSMNYQHSKTIDNSFNYDCQAIMNLPLSSMGGDLLGVLQIINPLDEAGRVRPFSQDNEEDMDFFAKSSALALEKALMLRRMTLLAVRLVSGNDPAETVGHAQRVAQMATEIYAHWSVKHKVPTIEREYILNILPLAAMLHDVGKSYVPRELLVKPGRLDQSERHIMESHVLAGAKVFLKPKTSLDRLTLSIILDHHERWDGLGYPGHIDGLPLVPDVIYGTIAQSAPPVINSPTAGKKGEAISIYGRILAVADVYDVLSNRRMYKEAFDEPLVVQIMEQESGHHFDPQVIESFLAGIPQLLKMRGRFQEVDGHHELGAIDDF
jgi:HD-GYP domain-containing protein (c-di-GMP phosphodiesterase class II)